VPVVVRDSGEGAEPGGRPARAIACAGPRAPSGAASGTDTTTFTLPSALTRQSASTAPFAAATCAPALQSGTGEDDAAASAARSAAASARCRAFTTWPSSATATASRHATASTQAASTDPLPRSPPCRASQL
jgi:hypothetical protein